MRILVDENIPNIAVEALRAAGHDVLDIRGTPQQGMFDDELWPLAQREQRMLITTDKGFTEHRDEQHHGCLIVRLRQPNEQRIHTRLITLRRKIGWAYSSLCVMWCRASARREPRDRHALSRRKAGSLLAICGSGSL